MHPTYFPLRTGLTLAAGLALSPLSLAAQSPEITPFALIEAEASSYNASGSSQTDIVLATFSAGFNAKFSDAFSATASLLYEEDVTDLEVDEAFIQWDFAEGFNSKIGQMYLPFGQFNSALVNDTLVLEVAETRESSALLSYSQASFLAEAYLFNGEVDGFESEQTEPKDQADNFGLRVGYQSETFNLGVDYASNLLDSDSLQGQASTTAKDDTNAWIIWTDLNLGDWKFIAEHLQSSVDAGNLLDSAGAPVLDDQEIRATQFEVNYTISSVGLAASYQTTDDALWLGLPQNRIALGAGFSPEDHATVKVEIWQDQDYSVADGGTGEDGLGLVAQLALEF